MAAPQETAGVEYAQAMSDDFWRAATDPAVHQRRDEPSVISIERTYLDQAGEQERLTAEQEKQLATLIQAGILAQNRLDRADSGEDVGLRPGEHELLVGYITDGKAAKERFILANLLLVASLARQHAGPTMPFLQAVQEGNIALIDLVERFDGQRGYAFSTFATPRIKGAILRARNEDMPLIRVPSHVISSLYRLRKARHELWVTNNRTATPQEIAAEMEVDLGTVLELLAYETPPLSLDWRPEDDDDVDDPQIALEAQKLLKALVHFDPSAAEQDTPRRVLLRERVAGVLGALTDRQGQAVRLRFGFPDDRTGRDVKDVGEAMGITHQGASQLIKAALKVLQRPEHQAALEEFLPRTNRSSR